MRTIGFLKTRKIFKRPCGADENRMISSPTLAITMSRRVYTLIIYYIIGSNILHVVVCVSNENTAQCNNNIMLWQQWRMTSRVRFSIMNLMQLSHLLHRIEDLMNYRDYIHRYLYIMHTRVHIITINAYRRLRYI